MTLTSYCTGIRVEVTGKHKEEGQHCTDYKVTAIRRHTLALAQLFKNLRPQHPLRLYIVLVSLFMWGAADRHTTKKNDSFLKLPCNKDQLDALFILSLFRQSTSTCVGHICSPSSGGIQQLVHVGLFSWLSVGRVSAVYVDQLLAGSRSYQQPVNINHHVYQLLYIQSSSSWWWAVSLLETCRG
jgi:hypothetical protein